MRRIGRESIAPASKGFGGPVLSMRPDGPRGSWNPLGRRPGSPEDSAPCFPSPGGEDNE